MNQIWGIGGALTKILDLFRSPHLDILFGFHAPMDSTNGRTFAASARKIVEDRGLSETDRQKIFNKSYHQVP